MLYTASFFTIIHGALAIDVKFYRPGVELLNCKEKDPVPELLQLARKCTAIGGLEPSILYGDIRVIELLFKEVPKQVRSELSLAFHNKDTAMISKICAHAGIEKELKEILVELPLIFGGKEALAELKKLCESNPQLIACFTEAQAVEGVVF